MLFFFLFPVAILPTSPDIVEMINSSTAQIRPNPPGRKWVVVFLAVVGAGFSLLSLSVFLFEIINNTLPWSPRQSIREYYLAVGDSFSQGFISGFFLCFFLAIGAAGFLRREGSRH
jgi:hypothetical protein